MSRSFAEVFGITAVSQRYFLPLLVSGNSEGLMGAAQNLRPWKPGSSGNPSGRRKRCFPYVDELLKAAGKEPIKELLALLPTLKERDQAQIWLEILPYVHAKAKPTEDRDEDELEKMSTAELVRLVKEQLPEIEEK